MSCQLTAVERETLRKALDIAIDSRLQDTRSFTVLARGDPQQGRIVEDGIDITAEVQNDIRTFRLLRRRLGGAR